MILDGDLRKGNNYKRLNADNKKRIGRLCPGRYWKKDMIYKTNWPLLDYIPCGTINLERIRCIFLYASKMAEVMEILEKKYDFVLIDVPSVKSSVDANIFAVKSDATIMVPAMDGSSKKCLEDAYEELIANSANVVGVIENKISMEEYKRYLKDYDYFDKKKFVKNRKEKYEAD